MVQRKINKRVKNAQEVKFGKITFKSKLELCVYQTLIEAGFKPAYEKRKYTLIESFKPEVPFFTKSKKTGELKLDSSKTRETTYTPDFTFRYKGYFVIVEAKGLQTDSYKIKKKVFRSIIEKTKEFEKILFFEVYSKKNVLQMIEILNSL